MPITTAKPQDVLASARTIVSETKLHILPSIQKARKMQEIYLSKSNDLYSTHQREQIKRWLNSVQFKYALAHAHLEELWALSMACRWSLFDILNNSIIQQQWNDDELMIGSMQLEAFVLQARSFLNVYMYYICLVLNIKQPGSITRDNFSRHLSKVKEPNLKYKATQLQEYFDSGVFGEKGWGALIKEIRDKITHRESLRPSRQNDQAILGVFLDWPTIQGMDFAFFAQSFSNGCFEMIRTTTPIMFDLEWKAGPYRDNLWS